MRQVLCYNFVTRSKERSIEDRIRSGILQEVVKNIRQRQWGTGSKPFI